MDFTSVLKARALGVLEGFTEYLPVSSTGHLLLAEHFLGLNFADRAFDKTFAVLIQLGSILALLQRLFPPAAQDRARAAIQRSARPQFHHRRDRRLPAAAAIWARRCTGSSRACCSTR